MTALDAGVIIRLGSGVLFLILGLAVLWVGRRKLAAAALGGMLIFYAAEVIVSNLTKPTVPSVLAEGLLGLAAGLLAVLAALRLPRPLQRGRTWTVAAGVSIPALAYVAVFVGGFKASVDTFIGRVPTSQAAGVALVLLIALGFYILLPALAYIAALRAARDPPADRDGITLAMGLCAILAPYFIAYVPGGLTDPRSVGALVADLVLVIGLAVPWLVVAARTGSRLAVATALTWPALGVLTFAYLALPVNTSAVFYDKFGLFGLLRLGGWVILVYAIVRKDLLGVPLPRFAARRGAWAGAALASLFIVAQVAQNFFAAQYGLLMGGIVAGSLVFAASPIQRAMEAKALRQASDATAQYPPRSDRREETYRKALRLALRDRTLTSEEESHLFELAEDLGIGAGRAFQLKKQVETEVG